MRRIGKAAPLLTLLPLLAAGLAFAQETEFYQTVDRAEVGTEDTLRLTVVVSNAPDGAELKMPSLNDFEVLSNTPVTSRSVQISGAGAQIQLIRKHILVLRPRRAGTLTIGQATLTGGGQTWKAEAIEITARKGRLQDPSARPSRPDPFRDFFGDNDPFPPGFRDPFGRGLPEMDIPRSDSDLFLRTYVDKEEAYVGEQVTLSVYVFSRVDLSSVDTVTLPRLEGFWSEDIDSPTQLSGETRVINGITYKAFLLKRRALFPLKAGKLEIAPVEADITTGYLFAGHRVHRKGNAAEIDVKPLPPGAPKGFSTTNVGQWRLGIEATPQQVKLGDPVTVRVTLEGRGNVKNVTAPPLTGPPSLKIYTPTTTDRAAMRNGIYGGRRVQEYLVMPTQTGTFTLPALSFPYFDPEKKAYDVARTEPVTLTIEPGAGGVAGTSPQGSPGAQGSEAPKNVLTAKGVAPPRHEADLQPPSAPLWDRPWFVPAVLAPLGVWAALGAFGLVRGRLGRDDAAATRKRKAKEARKRLQAAEALRASGRAGEFYAEVEKALLGFLEARWGEPLAGLTREALVERMVAHGVTPEQRARIVAVLETCEIGRYAPGAGDPKAFERVLDEAEAAMERMDTP